MLNYFCWDLNMATVCYTAELLLPYSLEIRELKPVTKRFHSFNTLKMELLKTVKEVTLRKLCRQLRLFFRCWTSAWWRKVSCRLSPQ